jgi:hypothetical protein
MKYFAEIDENNIVIRVITVRDEALLEKKFPKSETCGKEFLKSLGFDGTFVECFYEAEFRECYPGTGYFYNSEDDIFVAPFFNQDNNYVGLESI